MNVKHLEELFCAPISNIIITSVLVRDEGDKTIYSFEGFIQRNKNGARTAVLVAGNQAGKTTKAKKVIKRKNKAK